MTRKALLILLGLALVFGLAVAAWPEDPPATYPIMQPDEATLLKWIEDYQTAPKARIDPQIQQRLRAMEATQKGSSFSLLSYVPYIPSERNQGSCGNCWVWAGTGILEVALGVQQGISDRLSVQYLNSCYYEDFACCGGDLAKFCSFYAYTGQAIPWSNAGASYQDYNNGCETGYSYQPCANISTSPNYPIQSIYATTIPTTGVSQATAIANIKNVLHQNKAVWFAFYLPNQTAWDAFRSFWNNQGEDAVWSSSPYCGQTYDTQTGGGHAVLCVGYDDTNPNNPYWIMLNSWGTANGRRPNGLFRVRMNQDYNCYLVLPGHGPIYALEWQTIDVTFGSGGGGGGGGCTGSETPVSVATYESAYYYFDINTYLRQLEVNLRVNSGDLDLFVAYGRIPNRYSDNDCYSASWGALNEQCVFYWPALGRYYIQVYGWEGGSGCLSLSYDVYSEGEGAKPGEEIQLKPVKAVK